MVPGITSPTSSSATQEKERQLFLFFGEDWGKHPSTLQFLAKNLGKYGTIIWIESFGYRRPRFTLADIQRIYRRVRNWWHGPKRKDESRNIIVYSPLVLPLHGYRWTRIVNGLLMRIAIRRLLRSYTDGSPPVVVTASPSMEFLVGQLGEVRSIYYCADEYAQMPGVDPGLMRELEASLLHKVDAVVTTSAQLFKTKSTSGKPIILLRHGVDFDLFSQAALNLSPVNPLLHSIPRPIFGFHGLIQAIIDFDLISSVAQKRPDWSFVFIGGRFGDLGPLPSMSNIYYLPPQPYEMIPALVKGFDVCLIPYKLDERTRNANPVKLREYLAAGKPVLSTPLPEVLVYEDVVAFASTPDEFVIKGEQLLGEIGSEFTRKRMHRVSAESWDAVVGRFREMLQLLEATQPR